MQRSGWYLVVGVLNASVGCIGASSSDESLAEAEALADLGPKVDSASDGRTFGASIRQDGVRFRVWAPNAERVFVAGTFNAWNAESDELMRDRDGAFSGDIADAAVGDEYKYVIENNGQRVWRSDPYAREIDEDDGFNSVITDVRSFQWRDRNFQRPSIENMVIYEMHIPSFTTDVNGSHGTWSSAISRLDELADLGVNVLEVMPPVENAGMDGWGYGPISLFAAEQSYGSPDELKDFVQAAHGRGLAVILDWVPNHMAGDNVLNDFDGTNLYFYPGSDGNTPWGPRPNFSSADVRGYLSDNLRMWFDEYHFDGARVDSTINVRQSDGRDLPGGWNVMQDWNDFANAHLPGAIMIAEDLQGNDWINRSTAHGGAGFDSQWDEEMYWALHDAVVAADDSGRDIGRIAGALRRMFLGTASARVIYTENHDKVPSDRQQRLPRAISPASPEDYWALKRSTLAASVLFTAPGIPMLFEGQECLETTGFDFPSPRPIDWGRCDRFAGIRTMYRDLVGLRLNSRSNTRGLAGNSINVFHVNQRDSVVAYHRWDRGGPGDDVIVIANFSNRAFLAYDIGFPRGGTWRVRFNGDWSGYNAGFQSTPSHDTFARPGGRDELAYQGTIGVGPYSVVVLSQ